MKANCLTLNFFSPSPLPNLAHLVMYCICPNICTPQESVPKKVGVYYKYIKYINWNMLYMYMILVQILHKNLNWNAANPIFINLFYQCVIVKWEYFWRYSSPCVVRPPLPWSWGGPSWWCGLISRCILY